MFVWVCSITSFCRKRKERRKEIIWRISSPCALDNFLDIHFRFFFQTEFGISLFNQNAFLRYQTLFSIDFSSLFLIFILRNYFWVLCECVPYSSASVERIKIQRTSYLRLIRKHSLKVDFWMYSEQSECIWREK